MRLGVRQSPGAFEVQELRCARGAAHSKKPFAFRRSSVTFTLPLDDCRPEGNGFKSVPAWGWAAIITLNLIPCSAGWFAPDDGLSF
jgi:hypothetical protein